MLKNQKVAISGMTGVSDEVLNNYKVSVEAAVPGSQVDIISKAILSEDEVIAKMKGYDILMSGFQTMTDKAYAETDFIAYVACSIGYDFADVSLATKHGIVVCNNPTYCINEVAEHAVALLLQCARGLYKMIPYVKGGSWGFPILVPQNSFKGSTVGLYGFGNIPRLIAKKLSGFEVNLISSDPFVKQEDAAPYDVTMVSFDELLEQSDYICVQAPLLESTRGAFNAAAFSKMKKTAFIINTARGPLINQDDLYAALTAGQIKGAALDVLEHEPPREEDRKIVALPNVVCTGHSGFYSVESFANQAKLTVDNLVRVLNGQLPNNIVNREVLDRIDWGK